MLTKRSSHQHHYLFVTTSSFGHPFFTNRAPASLYSLLVDVTMAALFILWWSRCLRFYHLHQSHLPPPPAILSSTLPPSILSILLPPPTGPSLSTISYLHYVYHVSTSPLPQNTFVHLFHYISFINLPAPPSTSSESYPSLLTSSDHFFPTPRPAFLHIITRCCSIPTCLPQLSQLLIIFHGLVQI
jgi:hypothetical protein